MSVCKVWCGYVTTIVSALFLFVWSAVCFAIMVNLSGDYYWYKNSISTNATVERNWIVNDTYKDVCDPRCVKGCSYCTFPCYNGDVEYEYFDTNNKSYVFIETAYHCVGYNRVANDLEACCSIGKTIPLWYNKSNARDYRKTYKPTNFVHFAIAFPVVFVIVIVIIIVACIWDFRENISCMRQRTYLTL